MSKHSHLKIIILILAVFVTPIVHSANTLIQIKDGDGQPLKNAIVEVIGPSSTSDVASSEPEIMDQVNKRFLPDLLLIKQGQSVLFPNSDNIRHHVYSFSPAKQFELKLYAGKPKSSVEFEQNGVVIVGCNIHDSMVGSIYVAKNSAMITGSDGKINLDIDLTTDKISVWHPLQQKSPEEREVFDLNKATPINGHYLFSIKTAPPLARDTFGDTFGDD
jgi:plastocyanin